MSTQTFNISFPKQLIKIVDKFADSRFSSRSDFIRKAVISYIKKEREWQSLFKYGEKKAKELKIKEEDIEKIVDEYRQEYQK
ncbi:MAG: ribbon-helix-helix domain-containing protein [Candidatus Roizmanbacteria bacterium]|nr:ribbon-helix-helix domain-containing protein [Candidatus Roizmanbacteria bacterium]